VPNPEAARFYGQVADEVRALPGVASVGLTQRIPLGEGSSNGGSFRIEAKPRDESELPPVAMYKAVDEAYLQTLDIPILQGRGIARSDWEGGPPVAVVNKAFEDRYLDGHALGQAIRWDSSAAWARVVGVVGDVREQGLREPVQPWAYLPLVEGDWGYPNLDRIYLMIRGSGTAPLSVASVRRIVTRLNPSVPVTTVHTMDEVMSRAVAQTTFTMVLLGIAAGVALFLGAIGLFGVISYVVSQRTREIGVRVALGARRDDIRHLVFRQGAGVAVAGVLIGMVAAFGLSRLLGAVLFQVSTTDPLTFLGAPVILGGVAALATWLPARRAAKVDPLEALRSE
jgi:predicted permease